MKKYSVFCFLAVFAALCLSPLYAGGGGDKGSSANVLVVGATPVPHAELLNLVKADLAAQGIELRVVEFTDYVTPNMALDAGDLDANFFQHSPYLESFSAERNLPLVTAFAVHVEPLGFYSASLKNISDLKDGAVIAIPNDPTNEGRALLLLQARGLIKLSPQAGLQGTPMDITDNPKKLRFRELEAAQLPRSLGDVDGAIINGNYAMEAGLNPVQDALLIEGAESPYVNVVAVKKGNENDPRIKALESALRSQKIKEYILANYNGGVVAVF
ncbi:MetQ/NlpA family ABC transporter substrate-binding protein [Breznakiella homolactica]|uniref:Lipoprotein n=1 Tax=Breznakiella homolactica TaxID=2798577 RepID=A0A7T8BC00_9SPIR|nr:MetQ/NlpA family ABC transporter substrate-binding protein [Breznakiella homolactica]QQO11087.1 MetQ/NlpA family ABC transporter substrate-binding protein [Breznakiella homolactica]